ncbi:TonB-dependent hemoglobin/transferrin/lactoferrin family receptor [Sphingomonas immobilis]|nr:TonB-dependent hemoglobin/transferrin/lactoferrin family receptor [Sphingomonas sp. CA1-15]
MTDQPRNEGVRRLALLLAGTATAIAAAPAFAAPATDAAAPALSFADDENKDPVVVTGTRIPTPASEVPATVSVITAEDIANNLAIDIKDLIRFEPGVSVRRAPTRFGAALGVTGRDGDAGFNIRGLEGNRVLIQVDGVRVPDGFEFGAQSAGRGDYVDLGIIKSVEILRGPASALYGSDGLAGAVSFVTSDPVDFLKDGNAYGGLLRAGYDSSSNQFAETAILAGRSGDWSAVVSYTRRDGHEYENAGTIDTPNALRTKANPQNTRSNAVLGKIVWEPNDHHRIRLTLDHYDAYAFTNVLSGVAAVPTAATSVIGLTAEDTIKRDRISLDWRYTGEGAIDFAQVTGWYQKGKNRQFTAEDRNTAADRIRISTFDNQVWGVSVEARSSFDIGGIGNKLAFGGDVSVTRQEGIRDGTLPTAPDVFPTRAFPITDYVLAGGYLADTISLFEGRFQLFPALRLDYYKLTPKIDALIPGASTTPSGQDGSRLSPKIGALVKIPGGGNIFVNYARGFKAPSPTQVNQFFDNPNGVGFAYRSIPNPNLRPETSETWEAGIRVGSGPVRLSGTAFTGGYSNFISQEMVGGTGTVANPVIYQFVNLNRVRIKGAEGSLALSSPNGLSARVAISYAIGTVTGAGGAKSPLSTIDPLKLVMGLGYDDPGKRFGGQIIMTHSAQKELEAAPAGAYRPGDFTILDATAYVRIADFATLRAGVFNLLDTKYAWWSDVRGLADTSTVKDAYTQPGRNASISLSLRF